MRRTIPVLVAAVLLVAAWAHNFHVSYGRLAVQDRTAVLQLRVFTDDLEQALARHHRRPAVRVENGPEVHALVTTYVNARLQVTAGGQRLTGRLVRAVPDEEAWTFHFAYTGAQPLGALTVRNEVLMEVFDDQRNLFKVRYFPSETIRTMYFDAGTRQYEVRP